MTWGNKLLHLVLYPSKCSGWLMKTWQLLTTIITKRVYYT